MKNGNKVIHVADEDHIWVDGKQFVSLKRFTESRIDILTEHRMLLDRIVELEKENEHLRLLLWLHE